MAHQIEAGEDSSKRTWWPILLTFLVPIFMALWNTSHTFLKLCAGSCSYSNYTFLAISGEYIGAIVSIISLLAILFWVSLSWDNTNRRMAIVVFIVNTLVATIFFAGVFSFILEKVVVQFL